MILLPLLLSCVYSQPNTNSSASLSILDSNFIKGYLQKDISFNLDVALTGAALFNGSNVTLGLIENNNCLEGQTEVKSKTGAMIVTFSNLKITCTGNFTFIAFSSGFTEGRSKTVQVKQDQKKIIIVSSPKDTVNIGRDITVTISIQSTLDESLWPTDVNVTFYAVADDNRLRCEQSKRFLLKGGNTQTIHCYVESMRIKKLVAQVDGEEKIKAEIDIDVVPTQISVPKISSFLETSGNVTSDQSFWVFVQLQLNYQDITDTDLRIYLGLICVQNEADCSGTVIEGGGTRFEPKSTSGGNYNFTQVRILSQGEFFIYAFDADSEETDFENINKARFAKAINATNKVDSLRVSVNETKISAFQKFKVNVTVRGEDGGIYFNPTNIILDETVANRRNLLGGDPSYQIDAKAVLTGAEVYFEGYGKRKIRARVGPVMGYSQMIKVEGITIEIKNFTKPTPKNTRDPFAFEVYVKYATGELITDIDVPLTISTSPPAKYEGETEYKTKDGVAYVSGFYVKSGGTFKIKVTAGGNSQKTSSKFEIEGVDCGIGYGPLIAMILLLVIGVIFPCFVMTLDSKQKSFNYVAIKVLAIHPVSGLFYKQPNYRRSLLLMQIATCELLMLTLIGAIYGHFDTPTTHYDRNFEDYKNKEVYKGATGWALSQVVAVPLFYFNFKAAENSRTGQISAGVMLLLMGLSTGAIIGMTIKYCLGYFVFWIINFMVFLLFDFFFVQIIYSFVCLCFMSRMIRGEMESKPKKSQNLKLAEESEENSNRL